MTNSDDYFLFRAHAQVRLRGAIMNIAKSEMPSDYITDLLVACVEEGNYFTAGLLWDCEISRLDFTR